MAILSNGSEAGSIGTSIASSLKGRGRKMMFRWLQWAAIGCLVALSIQGGFNIQMSFPVADNLVRPALALLMDGRVDTEMSNEGDTQWNTTSIRFPLFNHTGVILFYHLAKTGGTTIRDNFRKLEHVTFVRALDETQFDDLSREIGDVMTGKLSKILFVEMHSGGPLPSIFELHPLMQEWRRQSRENGVPFFAFTLLRDPIHLHVSAFLFFHLRRCVSSWCSRTRLKPTQENLVSSVTPNRQCLNLAKGQGHPDRKTVAKTVSATSCQLVANMLREDWNWVGTTEGIDNTTLPLLCAMLNCTESLDTMETRNIRKSLHPQLDPANAITVGNLKAKTRRALEDMSRLDFELYEAFQNDSFAPVEVQPVAQPKP